MYLFDLQILCRLTELTPINLQVTKLNVPTPVNAKTVPHPRALRPTDVPLSIWSSSGFASTPYKTQDDMKILVLSISVFISLREHLTNIKKMKLQKWLITYKLVRLLLNWFSKWFEWFLYSRLLIHWKINYHQLLPLMKERYHVWNKTKAYQWGLLIILYNKFRQKAIPVQNWISTNLENAEKQTYLHKTSRISLLDLGNCHGETSNYP